MVLSMTIWLFPWMKLFISAQNGWKWLSMPSEGLSRNQGRKIILCILWSKTSLLPKYIAVEVWDIQKYGSHLYLYTSGFIPLCQVVHEMTFWYVEHPVQDLESAGYIPDIIRLSAVFLLHEKKRIHRPRLEVRRTSFHWSYFR